MLNGSALTPTIRRVFIPSKSGCASFLVEWADGGASRDHAATEAAIAEAVDRFLDENERQNGGME